MSSSALKCCETAAPLSPFMWDAPPRGVIVPVGCEPGIVADVCVQAKELSLRFDQLAGELEGPYYHPVSDVFKHHPLHTHVLSKHQFDILRYGLVLDHSAGLVLVPAPRQCGDYGTIVAQGFESLHGESLNTSEASHHPLHEEHVFVVYKLSDNETNSMRPKAKALFRIVFRNEAYLNNPSPDQSKHFPVYVLRCVYVSNEEFYQTHEAIATHRKYHPQPVNPETGAVSADARVLVELQNPRVIEIADAWLQVVEGIVASRAEFGTISVDANVSNVSLSSPRRTASALESPLRSGSPTRVEDATLTANQRYPSLSSRAIRTSYYHSYKRMESRVVIAQKTRVLVNDWRNGQLDMHCYSPDASGASPSHMQAPCVRVLFRETRSGRNCIEEGELVAFLPQESDCERLTVYENLPAERLRLWVLKALLTAELNNVHVLLLELDTSLMLAQCVGLLNGSETIRDREALFHLCKIFVETVEDYVQYSGNIWKATIAIAGTENYDVDVVALCRDILECIQLSKRRLEMERLSLPSSPAAQNESSNRAGGDSVEAMLTPEQLAAGRAPLSENVIFAATTHRVFVTDDKLYPLFQYCDTNRDGFVSVQDLVKLFLCKENKIDRHYKRQGAYEAPLSDAEALRMQASNLIAHPLCALDGCGLPFDETSVYKFIHSFCKHASRDGEEKLNYLEFSMMMLALARR